MNPDLHFLYCPSQWFVLCVKVGSVIRINSNSKNTKYFNSTTPFNPCRKKVVSFWVEKGLKGRGDKTKTLTVIQLGFPFP